MEKRALIFIFMVLVSMPAGRAGERETGEQVQRWLDSWTTLSGRFQQTLTSPTLPSAEVESGRFQVARPDRMRWDYRDPERKLAITDGRQTWLYLPDDGQVVHGSLDRLRREGAVSLLLSGTLRLEEAFLIDSVLISGDEVVLRLRSRKRGGDISGVDLRADRDSGEIHGFSMTDAAGNVVSWRFFDLHLNPRLKDGLFKFKVPEGVELQELEPAQAAVEAP